MNMVSLCSKNFEKSEFTQTPDLYQNIPQKAEQTFSPTATVRTRKMSLTLGKFGMTYTAKDLEIDPKKQLYSIRASQAEQNSSAQTLQFNAFGSTQAFGLNAYIVQLLQAKEENIPSRMLLSVV